MKKPIIYLVMTFALMTAGICNVDAQVYRRENRRGNRELANGNFAEAIKHYEKGLTNNKIDTLPLIYNMAIALHGDRSDSTKIAHNDTLALQYLDRIADAVKGTEHEFGYHFNRGVIALDMENWQGAMDEFKKCIVLDPNDMKARENYVYAKEHLQQDKGGGGGGGGAQDQQQDQSQDQQQDQGGGQGSAPEPRISEQNAQQMIQAIQAKERQTQEKVEKKKSDAVKSKPNRKNW